MSNANKKDFTLQSLKMIIMTIHVWSYRPVC